MNLITFDFVVFNNENIGAGGWTAVPTLEMSQNIFYCVY